MMLLESLRSSPFVGMTGRVSMGTSCFPVTVIEDRGKIGVGGRRLLRVEYVDEEFGNDLQFELPLDCINLDDVKEDQ
jgi:hypothetical protein